MTKEADERTSTTAEVLYSNQDSRTDISAGLKAKIRTLERQHYQNVQVQSATRKIEGETICRSWTQANKEAKPRDMIYALKKPRPINTQLDAPTEYEKHSQKMADLGRDYHDSLQGMLTQFYANKNLMRCLVK